MNYTCGILKHTSRWRRPIHCGRPTKGDVWHGTPICRTCLAGKKRSQAKIDKQRDEHRKEREYADEVAELLEKHGIDGHSNGYRQRRCVVSFDDLRRALDK